MTKFLSDYFEDIFKNNGIWVGKVGLNGYFCPMAKDIYHKIVKEALIKDGWTITHHPFLIPRHKKKPY